MISNKRDGMFMYWVTQSYQYTFCPLFILFADSALVSLLIQYIYIYIYCRNCDKTISGVDTQFTLLHTLPHVIKANNLLKLQPCSQPTTYLKTQSYQSTFFFRFFILFADSALVWQSWCSNIYNTETLTKPSQTNIQ